MSRVDIFFTVSSQRITQDIDNPVLHAGDKKHFYAVFDLEEAFQSIEPKAVFTKQGGSILMDLIKNEADKYECVIPWEAMYTAGFFTVGIFGGDMMLTNTVSVKVEKGCVPEGGKPLEPTPGWADVIDASIRAINKELEDKVDKVDGKGLSTNDYTDEDKEKVRNFTGDVSSVAGKKGDVVLSKEDVGLGNVDNTSDMEKPISTLTKEALNALSKDIEDTKESIPKSTNDIANDSGFIAQKAVDDSISAHNTNDTSHNDIRLKIKEISDRLNAFLDTDDETLDELSEIVAYITDNKELIDSITTSKVNVSDVIDNLTTNSASKPLSAKQGAVLKALVDAIVVPTKVSELTNDSGYLKESAAKNLYVEKVSGKGLSTNDYTDAEKQKVSLAETAISNINKKISEVEADIPKSTSELTNDSSFITSTETDNKITSHNTIDTSHNDIRLAIKEVSDRLNAFLDTDDKTLDQLSEIVDYITNNKELIDNITTGKVSVADIIDNLTTSVSNKPLSAKQGVALKALIDGLVLTVSEIDMSRPYIGANGNWYEYDKDTKAFVDSGVKAQGVNGMDGKDGYTPQKGIDYFDGADGQNGKDGYTPQRGTDYWTDADKAEIKSYVDEAILGGAW
jgi:hypothetical protein